MDNIQKNTLNRLKQLEDKLQEMKNGIDYLQTVAMEDGTITADENRQIDEAVSVYNSTLEKYEAHKRAYESVYGRLY